MKARILATASLIGAVGLTGCASINPSQPETKQIGGSVNDSRFKPVVPEGDIGVSSPEEAALIRSVAASRQSMTGFAGHSELRATYVGSTGRCEAVTVENRQFNKVDHFKVCDGRIARRNEVAPARPDVGDYDQAAMQAVKRDAIRYGSGVSQYQGYTYQAQRVGVPNAQGCMPVEVTVSYDGLLVDRSVDQVCAGQ